MTDSELKNAFMVVQLSQQSERDALTDSIGTRDVVLLLLALFSLSSNNILVTNFTAVM